jgi:purine-binding chemotaxis protein CheW|uniref:Purine-binding chemotaxis protein CheW n=1 Tax=candidate division WOR-3 bacterium TaxID=2052148 RepID=A0A7V3RGI3_UNCW3
MDTLIIFKIVDELIGIDIKKVREVTELADFVPVPKAPEFVLGLTNIRGEVVPILSLRNLFGISGEELSKILLVVEDEERVAGLRVDGLVGTKKIDERLINKNSELLSTKRERDFFLGAYETEEKPILILNLKRVLQ